MGMIVIEYGYRSRGIPVFTTVTELINELQNELVLQWPNVDTRPLSAWRTGGHDYQTVLVPGNIGSIEFYRLQGDDFTAAIYLVQYLESVGWQVTSSTPINDHERGSNYIMGYAVTLVNYNVSP